MPNWFNRPLKLPKVKHSVLDLSNDYKTSMRIGKLVPVYLEEMLPSDKFVTNKTEVFLRLAPMVFPLMHKIKIKTNDFFVPFRIVLGDDLYRSWLNGSIDIIPIQFSWNVATPEDPNPFVNSILDYLGCDILSAIKEEVSGEYYWTFTLINPLPYLSYFTIVRDWYLDSQIETSLIDQVNHIIDEYRDFINLGRGIYYINNVNGLLTDTFTVSYTKDYFNTARPQPQLGSEMRVLNSSRTDAFVNYATVPGGTITSGNASFDIEGNIKDADANNVTIYGFSNTDQTTIRDLWKKEQLQRYADAGNSFGTRIREQLAAHFGVIISDKRLEIPAYCGGSTSYVNISDVMQNSATETDSPLGSYAGAGKGFSMSQNKRYFCEEHGYYFTLLSLIPDNGYCRGQQRTFFKKNIFDFASPEFNNVGWQDIFKGELFTSNNSEVDIQTWAYQPRYSEYRSHPSRCTGDFRQSSLLAWHLNRNFGSLPPLNSNFLKVSDTERIFNYEDVDESFSPVFVDVYNHIQVSRPISYEPDSMHLY